MKNSSLLSEKLKKTDSFGSFLDENGDLISKTPDYTKFTQERFPQIYDDFFQNDENKFKSYLRGCREIAGKSGMATADVLAISLFAKQNNLAIIFRPINPKTREQMKLQDSIGKDSRVSPKSSNYGPICGNITRFGELSKMAESYDKNQGEIKKNNASIEDMLQRNLEKSNQITSIRDASSEELTKQKFLIALPKIVNHENKEFQLLFFPENENSNKAKADSKSRPYFAIKKDQDLLFYDYESGNYKKAQDGEPHLTEGDSKIVEILAYRSYEKLKDDDIATNNKSLLEYRIIEKAIIPDYDIYSLGKKIIFDDSLSLSSEDLAEKEFNTMLNSLVFDKIEDMSTVSYVDIETIRELKELTNDQINHGAENTNSNTQDLSNQDALIFAFAKDSDKSLESGVGVFKESKEEIIKVLHQLREDGYDIAIGSRWGFDLDRETGEISTTHYDEKIKNWKEKAAEEKKLIETLKQYCKELYCKSAETDFESFLIKCSEKFENKKIRKFIRHEYFSKQEIEDVKEKKLEIFDANSEKKIEILIDKLDIIAQEERIGQLKLAPILVYSNYQDLDEANKGIADKARELYQEKIIKAIDSKEVFLEKSLFDFKKTVEGFEDKDFCRIVNPQNTIIRDASIDLQQLKMTSDGQEIKSDSPLKFTYSITAIGTCLLNCFSFLKSPKSELLHPTSSTLSKKTVQKTD
jgi:hypothetical protein